MMIQSKLQWLKGYVMMIQQKWNKLKLFKQLTIHMMVWFDLGTGRKPLRNVVAMKYASFYHYTDYKNG